MRRKLLYTLVLPALLLAGCGQRHKAQSKVEDFMKEQMGISHYDVVSWSPLDSTFFLSDSMVNVMRIKAPTKDKKAYVKATPKVHFITLKYAVKKDTLSQTFYLDEPLSGIVAVKPNR